MLVKTQFLARGVSHYVYRLKGIQQMGIKKYKYPPLGEREANGKTL